MTEQENKENTSKNNILDETGLNIPEVEKGLSPVAALPGKSMLIAGAISVVCLILLLKFFVFSSEEKEVEEIVIDLPKEIITPAKPLQFELPTIPVLPDPPSVIAPEPELQPPAPLPEDLPVVNNISPPEPVKQVQNTRLELDIDEEEEEQTPEEDKGISSFLGSTPQQKIRKKPTERLNAAMFAFGGDKSDESVPEYNVQLKHQFRLSDTTADSVKVTYAGDMSATIVQGKIIDAVLETAINTDLAGTIRAIVARDVYSEAGRNVLIPRGSRIIGTYNAENIVANQKRIGIIWSRIIRPEGVDIQINSAAIDSLGRAGANGIVNNKFFETIVNAILISTVNVVWTKAVEDLLGTGGKVASVTSTNSDGSSSTTTTATDTDQAINDASENIGDAITNISEQAQAGVTPTFTIDQGKKIKIFVNRDLVFPYSIVGGANFIN
ncbi:MAG: TrbI/VirB10 family protein [Pseudomonadota bacterium]